MSMKFRTKTGCLPGEIMGLKLAFLESKKPILNRHHTISTKAIKSWRKVYYKKAKRRYRKGNNIDLLQID